MYYTLLADKFKVKRTKVYIFCRRGCVRWIYKKHNGSQTAALTNVLGVLFWTGGRISIFKEDNENEKNDICTLFLQ